MQLGVWHAAGSMACSWEYGMQLGVWDAAVSMGCSWEHCKDIRKHYCSEQLDDQNLTKTPIQPQPPPPQKKAYSY